MNQHCNKAVIVNDGTAIELYVGDVGRHRQRKIVELGFNVFERIKEERALGKGVLNSISTGFSRAFTAIFDSNLTTIISAVFLFQFGTGPIKGYAVTLTIGLTANLFTAVFVSRLLFDVAIPKTAKRLSI